MSGFFVIFLLLVKSTLLPHTSESCILLLRLGFLSEGLLSGSCKLVSGVLAPVGEVTVTLHVALRKAEDLQGL